VLSALAFVVSSFDSNALSEDGAVGLMQLLPSTAQLVGVDAWSVEENVLGGALYLHEQLHRFGTLNLALAAYNAGPTAVAAHGGVPPYAETQAYVFRVIALANEWQGCR
jgi:soluble lytic murein transglycosylase-like protein